MASVVKRTVLGQFREPHRELKCIHVHKVYTISPSIVNDGIRLYLQGAIRGACLELVLQNHVTAATPNSSSNNT